MAELTIVVRCETCPHSYRSVMPAEKRAAVRASRSNADIWAQTHRDLTEHARFAFMETTTHFRIFGSSGPSAQILLSEDPQYSTFHLGS